MKILIIEDSASQAELLKKIVNKIKYAEPILAKDAFEGYTILRAMPEIQLVILDNQLPFVNGIDFLRKIRSTPQFENLSVLISSSEDLNDDYIEAGANKIMIKPYDFTALIEYIKELSD